MGLEERNPEVTERLVSDLRTTTDYVECPECFKHMPLEVYDKGGCPDCEH